MNDDPAASGGGIDQEDDGQAIAMALKDDKDADLFSISIRQGKLETRLRSANSQIVSIVSSNTYNDGIFHNIVAVRTGKKSVSKTPHHSNANLLIQLNSLIYT